MSSSKDSNQRYAPAQILQLDNLRIFTYISFVFFVKLLQSRFLFISNWSDKISWLHF